MSGPTVLVLRALGLGDLLTAVPALRALHRAFPEHRSVLAAPGWLAPLVPLCGAVDELLAHPGLQPLPARRADVAVNLHGRGPQSHAVLDALHPARRIGHALPGRDWDGPHWDGPEWDEELPERDRWCRLLGWHGLAADPDDLQLAAPDVVNPLPGAAVVHPGAAYGAKRWPADRFAAVAGALRSTGRPVAVTGSDAERPLAEQVAAAAALPPGAVLAGRIGLAELAALVRGAAVLVCGDTGIAHLASAYCTPSVVLFGPVPARRWGPPAGGPHVALSVDAHRRGDPFADGPDPALLGVDVDAVLDAATQVARWPGLDCPPPGNPASTLQAGLGVDASTLQAGLGALQPVED